MELIGSRLLVYDCGDHTISPRIGKTRLLCSENGGSHNSAWFCKTTGAEFNQELKHHCTEPLNTRAMEDTRISPIPTVPLISRATKRQ